MKVSSLFISLLTTVAASITFTACTGADDSTTSSQQAQIINYAPAKASKIQITSGDNVLKTTEITSRAADVNSNMWDTIPDYPSQAEIDGVMAYLATKPAAVKWPGYTTYYVQQVAGAHHIYSYKDNNGATLSMDGTQSMEQLSIVEADGSFTHVNNFNGGNGNNGASHNCTKMTNGFQRAYALNEWSSSAIEAWSLFYYNGEYYLGLDYNMVKGDGSIDPDGCYDDWVLKIIPGKSETKVTTPESADPSDPSDPAVDPSDPAVDPSEALKGMVEVNLALNEEKSSDDYISSKLSVHVRDTADVEIFIPVPADLYCEADDMYIIKNHVEGNWVYNNTTEQVSMQVAGQTVTLTCTYAADGITIKTQGINAAVLKELRTTYGDGINFEIWNYYSQKADRATIQSYLNLSTIKFSGTVTEYLNAVNNTDTYTLDCTVTRKE